MASSQLIGGVLLINTICLVTGRSHFESTPSLEDPVRRQYQEFQKNEWQYEGRPIDLEGYRRALEAEKWQTLKIEEFPPSPTPATRPTTRSTTEATTPTPEPATAPSLRYRRIYNADETVSVERYPYMAAVLVNDGFWCGGALLARDLVITAAHCLQLQYNNRFFREYVKMLSVRVGSDNATVGGEYARVSEINFHPNYKPDNLDFNFAILRLTKNVSFAPGSNAAKIPFAKDPLVPNDRTVSFVGWGSVWGTGGTGGKVLLQRIDLPVYDLVDCQDVYGKDIVHTNNFCAGFISEAKNVCNHDAGGPAVMDGVLVGILSFSSKRCDELDRPAVFGRVGGVADWIEDINAETSNTALQAGLTFR